MPVDTVASLIGLLQQFPLLESGQMEELRSKLAPRFPEPRALAKELIQRNWLSPYQINQLFQGRGSDLILGQYILLERLGEGGMGQVFKARHRKLGRLVALKIIRRDRLISLDSIRRFQREVQSAGQLVHPNIVHAIDTDEIDGAQFFAMEFVEGIDLAKLVKQHGPLPVEKACDCIRQAALGLQHAYERGYVHRDIKPANLLLAKNGVLKVLDMGLARREQTDEASASTALTQEGAILGTPDYIAPEQARNSSNADIRSDLYSLGCAFYFLLTGQPPFPNGTLTEKLLQHQLDHPVPVQQLRPDVPPFVDLVLARLMAKHPAERFQTPAEVAAALVPGAPVMALPVAYPTAQYASVPYDPADTPMATPVPAMPVNPFADLETPLAMPVTATFTPEEQPPLATPVVRPSARRSANRLPLWLMAIVVLVVILFVVLLVIGVKLALRQAAVKPPDDPPPSKDVAQVDPKPRKQRADPVQAANALKMIGGRLVPADAQPDVPVTVVDLSGTPATDVDLIHLAALPNLTTVNLAGLKITDTGLAYLEDLTKITTLNLSNTGVTDEGLENLKHLTELQELNLAGTPIKGWGLANLKEAKTLTKLSLSSSKVEDLSALAGRTQLQLVDLSNCSKVNDLNIGHLSGATGLTDLNLKNTTVGDPGLIKLKNLPRLTRLDLTNLTKTTDAGLTNFNSLSQLTELNASSTFLGDKGLMPLREATKLQIVNLGATKVTDEGLAAFTTMPELHTLNLTNTRISDTGLAHLRGLTKLKSLDLELTNIGDDGLVHLKGLGELQTLNLMRTQVRGPGLPHLKALSKLTILSLNGTRLDAEGEAEAAELKKMLPLLTISR